MQEDAVSDSDDDDKDMGGLDEDEIAEIKRAKQRERELIQANKQEKKVESFEMIKPVIKGEADGPGAGDRK